MIYYDLRVFIDRVLRLKKQQDDLNEDIKQVYAEAHAARFDKTAMGKVVNHLRRHAKAGSKAQIADTTFEEYLLAYEHGTELANNSSGAHPHAGDLGGVVFKSPAEVLAGMGIPISAPPHDPTTGELIDDVPATGPATAPAPGAGSDTITAKGDVGEIDGDDCSVAGIADASPINSEICSPDWSVDPQINRACCVEAGLGAARAPDGIISGDETTERFPGTTAGGQVCLLDRPLLVTAGETAPFSNSAAGAAEQGLGAEHKAAPGPDLSQSVALALPVVTDAPEAPASPMPVEASGAPHSGEMPDLPAIFDRRSKAA